MPRSYVEQHQDCDKNSYSYRLLTTEYPYFIPLVAAYLSPGIDLVYSISRWLKFILNLRIPNMSKKRRLINTSEVSNNHTSVKTFPRDPLSSAIREDKRNWKGFCEIESEPVRICYCFLENCFIHKSDRISWPFSIYCSKTLVFPA